MSVVDGSFDHPLRLEEKASMPLAGGVMQYGFQCGMIWGAALAAGAQAHQLDGAGPLAETKALLASQRLAEAFRTKNKSKAINCVDITSLNKSSTPKEMMKYFLLKGGMVGCFSMAARYAPAAFDAINATFSEENFKVPPSPVSCAAELARKAGASDLHTTMAAGFAGGIGLCGGACGALGAAIWLLSMNNMQEGDGTLNFNSPRAAAMVDTFVEASEYEFECAEIAGRKFDSVADHAAYIQDGGCAQIIDVLATAFLNLRSQR